jgi:hypothetical protein
MPVVFEFNITAPLTPGVYSTHWGMVQDGVTWFGQTATIPIQVVPEPAALAPVMTLLLAIRRQRNGRRGWARAGSRTSYRP